MLPRAGTLCLVGARSCEAASGVRIFQFLHLGRGRLAAKNRPSDTPGGDETIPVVEDDPAVRESVATLLKSLGYPTLLAQDAPDAISQLESNHGIDLVFTDIVMPGGFSGFNLAREIERRWPDIKVVLTTGYSRIDQKFDIDGDIEVPLISKPYRRRELAKVLHQTLDRGGIG